MLTVSVQGFVQGLLKCGTFCGKVEMSWIVGRDEEV